MKSNLLSVRETAELLGVNRQRVHALIREGKLSAVKIGEYWAVDEASAHHRKATNPGPGRPKEGEL